MVKRERLEIIKDILKVIHDNNNSILLTPLLRRSNLSSSRFSEYFQELIEKGFVEEIIDRDHKKHIILTEKGFRYLEKYKTIIGFIEEFEL
jgi:predicted transcriptional regulator